MRARCVHQLEIVNIYSRVAKACDGRRTRGYGYTEVYYRKAHIAAETLVSTTSKLRWEQLRESERAK
jgi:hypothetical protein